MNKDPILEYGSRADEKQQSRVRDEARLEAGEISPDELKVENNFFAALPIKRFKIVAIGKRRLKRPL